MFKQSGPVTFSIGMIFGSVGGFVLGAILGKYVVQLFSILFSLLDRRGSSDDERLKFELLLQ